MLSSGLRIQDSSHRGDLAVELHLSVLKRYGTWRHCGHGVEIRPVGIMCKQDTFAKNSTPYVWDTTMGGKRVLVGEFRARARFGNSCVLVMDTKEVDNVVTSGSCVAALNRDV
ncbi:uncharacterized protein G6M90_00g105580 [Metarhizium brunneum]|uniref:Uncharacterized protein n=1 Tax=Metarhizium brunneum TaxID=500148 RepID=A0A7D5V2A3_9HYPO|nr:hypothetical protein G6M90_00g105580 [Metarhizium brunneum]